MKKLIFLLTVGLLSAGLLAGCSSGDDKKDKKKDEEAGITISEEGEWQGDSYVLKEYFLAFNKPESWHAMLPGEIEDVFGPGSSDQYKMIVVNNTQELIVSMFFEDSGGLDQNAFMKGVQEKMEKESGVTYKFESVKTAMVGGMEFSELASKIVSGGEKEALSNQINLAHQQGDRMLCINVKYNEKYEQVARDMLEKQFVNSGM